MAASERPMPYPNGAARGHPCTCGGEALLLHAHTHTRTHTQYCPSRPGDLAHCSGSKSMPSRRRRLSYARFRGRTNGPWVQSFVHTKSPRTRATFSRHTRMLLVTHQPPAPVPPCARSRGTGEGFFCFFTVCLLRLPNGVFFLSVCLLLHCGPRTWLCTLQPCRARRWAQEFSVFIFGLAETESLGERSCWLLVSFLFAPRTVCLPCLPSSLSFRSPFDARGRFSTNKTPTDSYAHTHRHICAV